MRAACLMSRLPCRDWVGRDAPEALPESGPVSCAVLHSISSPAHASLVSSCAGQGREDAEGAPGLRILRQLQPRIESDRQRVIRRDGQDMGCQGMVHRDAFVPWSLACWRCIFSLVVTWHFWPIRRASVCGRYRRTTRPSTQSTSTGTARSSSRPPWMACGAFLPTPLPRPPPALPAVA
jgi:hypothetical protein